MHSAADSHRFDILVDAAGPLPGTNDRQMDEQLKRWRRPKLQTASILPTCPRKEPQSLTTSVLEVPVPVERKDVMLFMVEAQSCTLAAQSILWARSTTDNPGLKLVQIFR
jgi:hypothetical protein